MTIDQFHSNLKSDLDLTQKYVVSFSKTKDRLANKTISHIVNNRGKMLRPILLILCGRYSFLANNENSREEADFVECLAKAAAILELVQISSLIHDDVLDQSMDRRNKSTLNKLKGNRFAILMGDYLIAQSLKNCYELIHNAKHIFDPVILYSYLDSISKLVLGEVQQNNFNNDEAPRTKQEEIDSYIEIVENKTASLFSLACFVGSTIASNNANHSELLKQFGHHVGIAYQIIDDLRDYAYSSDVAGEKNFQDIKFGIKTLPVILANHFSHNGELEKLKNAFNSQTELSESDKLDIIEILDRSGSVKNAFGEAKSHFVKARVILYQLPENKYSVLLGEFLNYLSEIGDKVVENIVLAKQQ